METPLILTTAASLGKLALTSLMQTDPLISLHLEQTLFNAKYNICHCTCICFSFTKLLQWQLVFHWLCLRVKHVYFLILCLQLTRKAQLDNTIQTVRLPDSEINIQENQQCRVAGWGDTQSFGKVVNELRMVDVFVINPQVCKDNWPGLPPKVICAGGFNTNKGFCQVCFYMDILQ